MIAEVKFETLAPGQKFRFVNDCDAPKWTKRTVKEAECGETKKTVWYTKRVWIEVSQGN